MEHAEYEMMFRAEDHHWWYRGMRAITKAVLDRFVSRKGDLTVLDAGCGTGANLEFLQPYGRVTGIDIAEEAVAFCRSRGRDGVARASIAELPFADSRFDLITSFDVISELDPAFTDAALTEFQRVLRPGGHVLLRLPAYQWLHGRHDELVHTRHRFTRGEIATRLRGLGFRLALTSYANCLLFPLAAAKRLRDRLLPPRQELSDVSVTGGFIDPLFARILRAEAPLVSRIGLPFGLTVIALAQKPRD